MMAVERVFVNTGRHVLLDDVSLEARAGEVLAVLGANGAGKTTLMRVMSGDRSPNEGCVLMGGRPMHDWTQRERARVRAVVPQESHLEFPFLVHDVVMMGRTPHVERIESSADEQIVYKALYAVGLGNFCTRIYPTLSGGEKRRVHLARALAQIWDNEQDRYLLLDEPTAGLDIAHQHQSLALVRALARDHARTTVIAVLHDLNLAAQYADRIVLLRKGQVVAFGRPTDVLTQANVRTAFGVESAVVHHPEGDTPMLITFVPICHSKEHPR